MCLDGLTDNFQGPLGLKSFSMTPDRGLSRQTSSSVHMNSRERGTQFIQTGPGETESGRYERVPESFYVPTCLKLCIEKVKKAYAKRHHLTMLVEVQGHIALSHTVAAWAQL